MEKIAIFGAKFNGIMEPIKFNGASDALCLGDQFFFGAATFQSENCLVDGG